MKPRLTVGSLRGIPQIRATPARPRPMPLATAAPDVSASQLTAGRKGRCCGTGCAGCPVGEAIRRARAARGGTS